MIRIAFRGIPRAFLFVAVSMTVRAQFKETPPAPYSPAVARQKIRLLLESGDPDNRQQAAETLSGLLAAGTRLRGIWPLRPGEGSIGRPTLFSIRPAGERCDLGRDVAREYPGGRRCEVGIRRRQRGRWYRSQRFRQADGP